MTMDEAFDARLRAAFAHAAEPLERDTEAEAFAHKMAQRLARPDRKRTLMLGGAGSTGSAIAGSQLETVFSGFQAPAADGIWAAVGFLATPEAMAAFAMAGAIAIVAAILPRRLA